MRKRTTIIRCGAAAFDSLDKSDIIKYRKQDFEWQALVADRESAKRKYSNFSLFACYSCDDCSIGCDNGCYFCARCGIYAFRGDLHAFGDFMVGFSDDCNGSYTHRTIHPFLYMRLCVASICGMFWGEIKMPFYDLRCNSCGKESNIMASISDKMEQRIPCPECGLHDMKTGYKSAPVFIKSDII